MQQIPKKTINKTERMQFLLWSVQLSRSESHAFIKLPGFQAHRPWARGRQPL